jgi:hypothetical protein
VLNCVWSSSTAQELLKNSTWEVGSVSISQFR